MNLLLKSKDGKEVAEFVGDFMYAYDYRDKTLVVAGTAWKCISAPADGECTIDYEIRQQQVPVSPDMLKGLMGGMKQ